MYGALIFQGIIKFELYNHNLQFMPNIYDTSKVKFSETPNCIEL